MTVAAWAGSRDTHLAGLDMAVTVAAPAGSRDTHQVGLDMAVMVAVRGTRPAGRTRPAVGVGPRAEAWAVAVDTAGELAASDQQVAEPAGRASARQAVPAVR